MNQQPKKPKSGQKSTMPGVQDLAKAPVLSHRAVFLDLERRVSHLFSGTSPFLSCLHFSAGTIKHKTLNNRKLRNAIGYCCGCFSSSQDRPCLLLTRPKCGDPWRQVGDTRAASEPESHNALPCLPIPTGSTALSPRAWRPRTEPSSSGGLSTIAWQGPMCVRPPTPSARARARWRSISQVGGCTRPCLSLPTTASSTVDAMQPSGSVIAGSLCLLFLFWIPLELWPFSGLALLFSFPCYKAVCETE